MKKFTLIDFFWFVMILAIVLAAIFYFGPERVMTILLTAVRLAATFAASCLIIMGILSLVIGPIVIRFLLNIGDRLEGLMVVVVAGAILLFMGSLLCDIGFRPEWIPNGWLVLK